MRGIVCLVILTMVASVTGVGDGLGQPIQEAPGDTVGYASVAAALQALRARPDVVISEQHGWIVADDRANNTLWSFTPKGHPAFPAAVKREIVQKKEGIFIDMSVRCEASKQACDNLVVEFQKLNDAAREHFRRSN